MNRFDLTPDPKVLIALTRTPMQPMDTLCELIDNSIDAFQVAKLQQGYEIQHPFISIIIPRQSELLNPQSVIRITDNGPGLTWEMAEKALRAGYSGNNPYDSLGLFGLGFNIATGKLGRITRLFTARKDENSGLQAEINLESIRDTKSYSVLPEMVDKPYGFESGTIIEVGHWWPEGDPNCGFVKKLVQYGMPTIRLEIGRRYATILREGKIVIKVNNEECIPFEHCSWDDSRFVERKGHGHVPAILRFNELIGIQKRCCDCMSLIDIGNQCLECGSSTFRTLEERIRGWVGIQRFDDATVFGIDLIRNGRAIRIAEKAAFFEYVDEFKRVVKDYPIDSQYGRIIGEVHLNHVPVDFLKQDFQRSSPEWQRAMNFLRGESSLQPTQPNAELNVSPVYKLYQGYRRVRTPGKVDLYMGYWDQESKKPSRISRDIEKQYYDNFTKKLPGFYDDGEWWKLVDQADKRPLDELVICFNCNSQNLQENEICDVCGQILCGKKCIDPDCGSLVPLSAQSCPVCGCSQVPDIQEPWRCFVCDSRNDPVSTKCFNCNSLRGIENTLSKEYLSKHSFKNDELSVSGCMIMLADGTYSTAVDVNTYITHGPIRTNMNNTSIPMITFKEQTIDIFVDKSHELFRVYRINLEQMIASDVALFIFDRNRRLVRRQFEGIHSLSFIQWQIMNTYWADLLAESAEQVRNGINIFFSVLRARLPFLLGEYVVDFFDEMTEEQKRYLVNNIISNGKDIGDLGTMKRNGEYLSFINDETVISIFKDSPHLFFDGSFWEVSYSNIQQVSESVKAQIQLRTYEFYRNCLEDINNYVKHESAEILIMQRAKTSLDLLKQKVVDYDVSE